VTLVPQQAVVQQLDKAGVWVVDRESLVSFRTVTLGDKFGHYWIVDGGLGSGEMVVVSGLDRLHDGQKVIAELAKE
jgi:membrane fusion protein (multidrug efflux system)